MKLTRDRRILAFIAVIRESHPSMSWVFVNGACWNMHLILKAMWPRAVPYMDWSLGHVYSKIGKHFYDIEGRVSKTRIRELGVFLEKLDTSKFDPDKYLVLTEDMWFSGNRHMAKRPDHLVDVLMPPNPNDYDEDIVKMPLPEKRKLPRFP